MSPVLFLIRKNLKNSFLEMLHHPVKLITYVAVIALLGVSIIGNAMEPHKATMVMDIRILHGCYFAVLLFIGVMTLLNGLKSGTTFFSMSDVNLMFTSPLSPKRILAYGLVKQMGTSLLVMLFLLFYGPMLTNSFGVGLADVILLVLGLALLLFVVQIFALLIYSFSNGRPRRIRGVKFTIYGLVALLLCYVGNEILSNGSNLKAVYPAISSQQLEWFPIIGWIKGAVFGMINGNVMNTVVYMAITVAAVIIGITLFIKSNTDYYEDVLQSTENTDQLKKAMKDGNRTNMAFSKNKHIQVRDIGINNGWGASAFFYKHIREAKRRSRLVFVNGSTLLLLIISLAMVLFIGKLSSGDKHPISVGMLMMIALAMTVYIQLFLNAAGDWSCELMKPTIYLVPETSFKKMIWASMTTILKPVIDGIIIFTVLCAVLHANPLTAIICALIYGSSGFLFTANGVLSQRLFGSMNKKGLLFLVYMLVLAIIAAPGVTCSILLAAFGNGLPGIVVGLPVVIWNIGISIGIFAACKNILDNMELNY